MLDWNSLITFSHNYCIAICAVLVPLNLLATLQTLILTILKCPRSRIQFSVGGAIVVALAMVFHVMTWLMVGVVRVPTFVLLMLAITCLAINLWTLYQPHRVQNLSQSLGTHLTQLLPSKIRKAGVS